VQGFPGDKAFISFAQAAPSEGRSQVGGHGATLRLGGGRL
jgi:hypothetical protein